MDTTYQAYIRKRGTRDLFGDALSLLAADLMCSVIDSIATQLKNEIQKSLYYDGN